MAAAAAAGDNAEAAARGGRQSRGARCRFGGSRSQKFCRCGKWPADTRCGRTRLIGRVGLRRKREREGGGGGGGGGERIIKVGRESFFL